MPAAPQIVEEDAGFLSGSDDESPIVQTIERKKTGIKIQKKDSMPLHEKPVDAVFLGHPAFLPDIFALFSKPSFEQRWEPSWWMFLFLPILWLIGIIAAHARPFFCRRSHLVMDDVAYNGLRVQTWIVTHFGRHFRNEWERKEAKRNVELAALHAEALGARVLGLGAMNKAEFLNKGGEQLLPVLPSDRTMAVTHGNHLTAAAVMETVKQLYEVGVARGKPCFFTGATSKTGRAVAIALHQFFNIPLLCHSTSEERREELKAMGIGATSELSDGRECPFWIVGKFDFKVCEYMPESSVGCVFSVPSPLDVKIQKALGVKQRYDILEVEGATMHIDSARLSRPRKFANKLMAHEIFACNAGAILRAATPSLGREDELGKIEAESLQDYIERAKAIGLTVPPVPQKVLDQIAHRAAAATEEQV